jgi:hypothetical protein
VRLAPFTTLGVPELEGDDARACHAEVSGVEDVAGGAVDVDAPVAEAEELQDGELARERHGDAFGAAFLVAGGDGTEHGAPGLAGLVPCAYGRVGDGGDGGVFVVEVEFPWGGFLEELAAAVAEELVQADLDFEGVVCGCLVEGLLLVLDEWDLLVGGFCAEDVAEGDILEAEVLADVVVVGDVDSCRYPVWC